MPPEPPEEKDELDLLDIVGPRPGRHGAIFALRVKGDSMRDEGILEGDYVLVERSDTAQDGERVVALIHAGTTLKTFYRDGDKVRLQPANRDFQPLILPAADVKIQGIVRSVLRKY